jgi:ABC-2 type transport system permease protein
MATVAGLFTNTVFGFLLASVLLAVYGERAGGTIGGFDATDAVTFTFVAQGYWGVLFDGWHEMGQRIRTGDVVIDLYRPVDFQAWWFASDAGRMAFQALTRGAGPFLVGSLAFDLRLSPSRWHWVAFLAALGLAAVLSFAIRFLVSLSTFWLLDARGPTQIVSLVWLFLSGLLLPLPLLPGWVESVARASPFAAVVQLPIEVVLGKHAGPDLAAVFATQAAWAVVLLAAGRATFAAAARKVVVQGG